MSYVHVSLARLVVGTLLVAVAWLVSHVFELRLGKSILVGTVRAAVQLIAIGYALIYLFGHQSAVAVLVVLAVMLGVAASVASRRVGEGPSRPRVFPLALVAISTASLVALLPVFLWVVPPEPWYEARYIVPLSGMMISSAMNVAAQVFERVIATAQRESDRIEQLLLLGASPAQAMRPHVQVAVRAALIPTLNGLSTVGLVSLPGMMTGQILSGADPSQAVRYQLVVMYQLVAVAAVSAVLAATLSRRVLFSAREQLRVHDARARLN
jgi:putative ABC transport system permease protein